MVTIQLEMAKNHLQLLRTPTELDMYLLQAFFLLEVTAIQAGMLSLLTHGAFNLHRQHVFQPSDDLEKAVSSFKVRAGERDAKVFTGNQVVPL